jgi:diaminopimelate epimerase
MKKIDFTKMEASGNDFVLIRQTKGLNPKKFARNICHRKYGVGADGLLVLEKSKIADIKMSIFNSDGSEAEMCGNGARCAVLWARFNKKNHSLKLETKSGIIQAKISDNNIKIKLTQPKKINPAMSVRLNKRPLRLHFVNTGVPHAVIFVDDLDNIDLRSLGRKIRFNPAFSPQGTNVDFVEVLNYNSLKVRTYERGVEGETLACGTGVVAAALMTAICNPSFKTDKMKVVTKSGKVLKVYFKRIKNKFKEVWLEGKARIVYKGEYYV